MHKLPSSPSPHYTSLGSVVCPRPFDRAQSASDHCTQRTEHPYQAYGHQRPSFSEQGRQQRREQDAMVGTRRSARSALFTPTSVRTRTQAKYDYKWLSTGRAHPPAGPTEEGDGKVYHTSFARIKRSTDTALPSSSESSSSSSSESESETANRAGSPTPTTKGKGKKLEVDLTPKDKGKAKGKATKKKKGDEARFTIGDGVQVAVEGGKEGVGVLVGLWEEPVPAESDDEDNTEDRGTRMMARIHWFFRRQDLPSVMRNLDLEDVSWLASFCN